MNSGDYTANTMIDVTDRDFDKEVLECQLPVLVCFTAKWCQSCLPACRFSEQLAGKYNGNVKFVRLDMERNPEITTRYHIIVVPTIILFQNSQPVKRLLGFQERWSLRAMLDSETNRMVGSYRKV